MWGDSTDADVASSATNQFTARASGGVRFFTSADLSTGAELAAGSGSWSVLSDRNVKHQVEPVDAEAVLEKVSSLPLSSWSYKAQDPSVRHIGPMAQDFHAAFGVGEDNRRISAVDADGVALAAIQGLNQKLEEVVRDKAAKITELEARLANLERLVEEIVGSGPGRHQ